MKLSVNIFFHLVQPIASFSPETKKFTSKLVNGKEAIIQIIVPITKDEFLTGTVKKLEIPRIMPDGSEDIAVLTIPVPSNSDDGYVLTYDSAGEYLEKNRFQDVYVVLRLSHEASVPQEQSYINGKFCPKMVNGKQSAVKFILPITSHELIVGTQKELKIPRIMPDGSEDIVVLNIPVQPNSDDGFHFTYDGAGKYLGGNKFQDVQVILHRTDTTQVPQQQSYMNEYFWSRMLNESDCAVNLILPISPYELMVGTQKELKIPRIMPDGSKDITVLNVPVPPHSSDGYVLTYDSAGDYLGNNRFQDVEVILHRWDLPSISDQFCNDTKFFSQMTNGKQSNVMLSLPITSSELKVGAKKELELSRTMPGGTRNTAVLEIAVQPGTHESHEYYFQDAGEYLGNNRFQTVQVQFKLSDA